MLRQMLFVVRSAAGSTAQKSYVGAWGFLIVLLTTALFPRVGAGDDRRTEGWQVNFEKAEAQAKEQGVPLVVHFHAHWCGPCRTMESEVLETAEVHAALRSGIIGVKVNADDRRDLVSRFGISALPTDVIISPNGQVLSKSAGSPGRSAYVARLAQHSVSPKSSVHPNPPAQRSETAIARTTDQTEKAPVTNVSHQQNTEVSPELSVAVQSEIVALEGTPADNSVVSNGKSEASGAKDVVGSNVNSLAKAMTKALRRESDSRIGLHGYSPVSLTEMEAWKTGDAQFKYEFQGVSYQLSSAEELDRFKASPEKFVPALHGCDPVALVNDQVVQAGHIELGVTWRSKVYFFYSKETRDVFLRNPEKFVQRNNLTFFSNETQG